MLATGGWSLRKGTVSRAKDARSRRHESKCHRRFAGSTSGSKSSGGDVGDRWVALRGQLGLRNCPMRFSYCSHLDSCQELTRKGLGIPNELVEYYRVRRGHCFVLAASVDAPCVSRVYPQRRRRDARRKDLRQWIRPQLTRLSVSPSTNHVSSTTASSSGKPQHII